MVRKGKVVFLSRPVQKLYPTELKRIKKEKHARGVRGAEKSSGSGFGMEDEKYG